MNSKAYLKLTKRRNDYEEELQELNNQITFIKDKAKKLKKGSEERKFLMSEAQDIRESKKYQELTMRIEELNYSINIFFYN